MLVFVVTKNIRDGLQNVGRSSVADWMRHGRG